MPVGVAVSWVFCPEHNVSFVAVTVKAESWPTVMVTWPVIEQPVVLVAVTLYVVVVFGVAIGDWMLVALKVGLGAQTNVMPFPDPGVAVNCTGPGMQIVLFGVMVRLNVGFTCTWTESR